MNHDPVFDPLYKVDRFLRNDLEMTLESCDTRESTKECSMVHDSMHQVLVGQRTNLRQKEFEFLQKASAELDANLNAIANILRETAFMKGTAHYDVQRYLAQRNEAINQAQLVFQSKLSEFEKLHKRQ